ncbi:hypothetical protein M441DRAFT_381755 [Trichoderma asperellum CBS 433.97]|uniref:Uncharacterized protein n=1 Tax=Trichoderma asperellum (strain ATCC 204424 / CBS 433.97 / NBRC 101777) TaxID=1042311 RepID=A0A2T3ZB65_TRIA4|nr:hypothetical protein M441DRAFT_381755 [Trichoderma asperellum CBS 433.97]PTB42053.1 hypothetical protein M441DRAFT_381755 [Trichoderma asperellum CBS 433.97]
MKHKRSSNKSVSLCPLSPSLALKRYSVYVISHLLCTARRLKSTAHLPTDMDKAVLRGPQVRSANRITTIVKLFVNNSHKTGTFYSKEKLTTYHKPSTVDKELYVSDTFSPWDFASVLYLPFFFNTTIAPNYYTPSFYFSPCPLAFKTRLGCCIRPFPLHPLPSRLRQ